MTKGLRRVEADTECPALKDNQDQPLVFGKGDLALDCLEGFYFNPAGKTPLKYDLWDGVKAKSQAAKGQQWVGYPTVLFPPHMLLHTGFQLSPETEEERASNKRNTERVVYNLPVTAHEEICQLLEALED